MERIVWGHNQDGRQNVNKMDKDQTMDTDRCNMTHYNVKWGWAVHLAERKDKTLIKRLRLNGHQ